MEVGETDNRFVIRHTVDGYWAVLDTHHRRVHGAFSHEWTCYKFIVRHLGNGGATDRCAMDDDTRDADGYTLYGRLLYNYHNYVRIEEY